MSRNWSEYNQKLIKRGEILINPSLSPEENIIINYYNGGGRKILYCENRSWEEQQGHNPCSLRSGIDKEKLGYRKAYNRKDGSNMNELAEISHAVFNLNKEVKNNE